MARALVAGSSAAVLVLEILAGRLLAPYVGVSLETFTGIIGIVLAGIATGAWAGGALADRSDARPLIGASLAIGGGLTWLVLPILSALGPQFGDGTLAIIVLSTAALFLPAAVLTAVSPMVAKLRLGSLDDTGAVVGGLSAAGTLGGTRRYLHHWVHFGLCAAHPTHRDGVGCRARRRRRDHSRLFHQEGTDGQCRRLGACCCVSRSDIKPAV